VAVREELQLPREIVVEKSGEERVAVRKELQLPREIVVEKSGEFREACPPPHMENGNPEPSPELSQPALHRIWRMVILSQALNCHCSGKVQRLELRLVLRTVPGEAPDTLSPGMWDG